MEIRNNNEQKAALEQLDKYEKEINYNELKKFSNRLLMLGGTAFETIGLTTVINNHGSNGIGALAFGGVLIYRGIILLYDNHVERRKLNDMYMELMHVLRAYKKPLLIKEREECITRLKTEKLSNFEAYILKLDILENDEHIKLMEIFEKLDNLEMLDEFEEELLSDYIWLCKLQRKDKEVELLNSQLKDTKKTYKKYIKKKH